MGPARGRLRGRWNALGGYGLAVKCTASSTSAGTHGTFFYRLPSLWWSCVGGAGTVSGRRAGGGAGRFNPCRPQQRQKDAATDV